MHSGVQVHPVDRARTRCRGAVAPFVLHLFDHRPAVHDEHRVGDGECVQRSWETMTAVRPVAPRLHPAQRRCRRDIQCRERFVALAAAAVRRQRIGPPRCAGPVAGTAARDCGRPGRRPDRVHQRRPTCLRSGPGTARGSAGSRPVGDADMCGNNIGCWESIRCRGACGVTNNPVLGVGEHAAPSSMRPALGRVSRSISWNGSICPRRWGRAPRAPRRRPAQLEVAPGPQGGLALRPLTRRRHRLLPALIPAALPESFAPLTAARQRYPPWRARCPPPPRSAAATNARRRRRRSRAAGRSPARLAGDTLQRSGERQRRPELASDGRRPAPAGDANPGRTRGSVTVRSTVVGRATRVAATCS